MAFVLLFVLLAWNLTGYELAPGVVTHTIGPCEAPRLKLGYRKPSARLRSAVVLRDNEPGVWPGNCADPGLGPFVFP